jgi:hypothetical protein
LAGLRRFCEKTKNPVAKMSVLTSATGTEYQLKE